MKITEDAGAIIRGREPPNYCLRLESVELKQKFIKGVN